MARNTASGLGVLIFLAIIAYHFILYHFYSKSNRYKLSQANERYSKLSHEKYELINDNKRLVSERNKAIENFNSLERILQEKAKAIPWLATAWAEYEYTLNIETALYLANKKHPALSTAEIKKEAARKQRESDFRAKSAEYKLEYLIDIYPWLLDEFDEDRSEIFSHSRSDEEIIEDDRVLIFLDRNEYLNLSTIERNQLALDRYINRNKSKKEIGREYERYIGYKYESEGWRVIYHGIVEGFEDMGRDIIAKKSEIIHIVQCKCWSSSKIIREKHIFQLLGSTLEYAMQHNIQYNNFNSKNSIQPIKPVFVATTGLSDVARIAAEIIGVTVKEIKLPDSWPRVKCNISKKSGEKIYHLPFDQQYDKIAIEIDNGEFYADSVAEAESAGFRRAFRWHGN